MEEFNVDNILREIETYEVNRENAITFILQDKASNYDSAFFFYKSSLLQLLQCRNHLDRMLSFYYDGLSIGIVMDAIYKSFLLGENESLVNIFKYVEFIESEFLKLFSTNDLGSISFLPPKNELIKMIKILDIYIRYRNEKQSKLRNINKTNDADEINRQISEYNNRINAVLIKIRDYFSNRHCDTLYEELDFEGIIENDVPEESTCLGRFQAYLNLIIYYYRLIDDIVKTTSVIKGYYQIKEDIYSAKSLRDVCTRIRSLLFGEGVLQFRECNLVANSEFMKNTSPSINITSDFDKLEKQYEEMLQEKDNDLFIRKCADFHFDFLRVHPFSDGNGRTSRILLVAIFLSRNIMFPSLYRDDYEKSDFYVNSDTALLGDYRNIEQSLFEKLGRYYPSIIPPSDNNRKK